VVLTQTGWKQGDEWDRAYDYLSRGNAMLLTNLYKRFVSGPVTWPKSERESELARSVQRAQAVPDRRRHVRLLRDPR